MLITLPHGFWVEGIHHRFVELRGLTGADEAFWLDAPSHWALPQRIAGLLLRCINGKDLPATGETLISALPVGDREALLLHLRSESFGGRMSSVLPCPQCRERLDLDLEIADLLLPPYSHPQPWYDEELQAGNEGCIVRYRLPTAGDLEIIAPHAAFDQAAATTKLIERCLAHVAIGDKTISQLPEQYYEAFAAAVARRDPQAELTIAMVCPACSHDFTVLLDMATYLGQEIEQRAATLYREVHILALAYHWSESDILRLPVRRRRLYLDLLDAAAETV